MNGDIETRQARYVPLEVSRDDHAAQPSVVVLPVPEPYAQRFISPRSIEKSLPDAVGAYIHWLIADSGWTVTERPDTTRRVRLEARHICVLFRRFLSYGEDVTRPYVEALDARGVKHLLVGGKAFHDREEIETLRAALTAIEWPDDQLSVFATLRGALFAIGDEELLEYYHLCGGRFHPFRVPESIPQGLEPVREALTVIASLHRLRNRRPITETIGRLIAETRAHVGFVLRPGGEQALANVLHVSELARQYELEGGMSFRGFVERLREAALGGQSAEAPILEEGSDGVRLMTVHKAKGLEFPVVILGDITARTGVVRAEDRRLVPEGVERQPAVGTGARTEGRRAHRVRGRNAGTGSARRAGGWRRTVHGRMGGAAQHGVVSTRGSSPRADDGPRLSRVRQQGFCAQPPRRRSGEPTNRLPRPT
jgi:ATP-dependent helicase/nuclease subunit A